MPKAFIPVLGIPSIQYSIDLVESSKVCKNIGLNYHYLPEVSKKQIASLDFGSSHHFLSDESALLLGSGGGIRALVEKCTSRYILILNADIISDISLDQLFEKHQELEKKNKIEATLVLCLGENNKEGYREVVLNSHTGLIEEMKENKKGASFYGSAMVVNRASLLSLPLNEVSDFTKEFFLPQLKKNKLAGVMHQGFWRDTGSPALWMETHFELMKAISKSKFQNKRILERVLNLHQQVGPQGWIQKKFFNEFQKISCSKEPYYFAASLISASRLECGPQTVAYGNLKEIQANTAYFDGKEINLSDRMH